MDQVVTMSAFVQVVNAGSFSGAAKRLDISPASVTSRIQSLEQQLGIRLLNRTTRKVSLTEEGEAFYQRCNRILIEIAEVANLASALQAKPSGRLRINVDIALARIIAPLVGDYAALYPDVSCELIMTEQMVNIVEEKFDLAIFAGPLRDSALVGRRLGAGRVVICAAPDYLARYPAPQHPSELVQHNCLDLVNGGAGNPWRFTGSDGEHRVTVAGNLRSNSIEGLRAGTLAGQGICLLPFASVAEDIERGALIRLLPDYEVAATPIQAVYPPSRHLPTKVRALLDFLIERLRDTGSPDRKEAKLGEKTIGDAKPGLSRNPACRNRGPAAARRFEPGAGSLPGLVAHRPEPMRMTC